MPATPLDSALYGSLLGDPEVAALFTDRTEIRAMLLVEGALAQAQGALGLIPETSARAIQRAAHEVQIDPADLATETGLNAVPVPALVAAFRAAMAAPEQARHIHWGATSQDIIDTALILRLRRALEIAEGRLVAVTKALGTLAERHATLPMAGRTYAQVATPTSFGAIAASWGLPLLAHRERLAELRPRLLQVSLSGAAGTLSVMGDSGAQVRASMAGILGLRDPGASWHSTRDTIAELAGWLTLVTGSLGKLGEDLILMTQSGIGEVRLATGGSSSTMPQKINPVAPSLLAALARQTAALNTAMQGAIPHRQQRDGAAWITEWLCLPQMVLAATRALAIAEDLVPGLTPDPDRMAALIDDGTGLIHAEALSFALAGHMPRPEAQAAVKALCKEVSATGKSLSGLAKDRWPEFDLSAAFDPAHHLGDAPAEARAFAGRARNL